MIEGSASASERFDTGGEKEITGRARDAACVYCLANGVLRDDQILVRGRHLYLCAPRGQLVEGYLAVAPYACIACFASMPAAWWPELLELEARIAAFYRMTYGDAAGMLVYEQGRGGGAEDAAGFPLHAHLCALPLAVDPHEVLTNHYARRRIAGLHELPAAAGDEPYLYVESAGAASVYLPRTPREHAELANMRFKPVIAALAGFPDRGHWRAYPGDRELARMIDRFHRFEARRAP